MKTDPSRKKYDVRKLFLYIYFSQSNYPQLLEFTIVFFFVSADIIAVGQQCLTIKELERSRQNQAITLVLSALSNTNMVADIIPVSLKAELSSHSNIALLIGQ